jgi:hypothetical protein
MDEVVWNKIPQQSQSAVSKTLKRFSSLRITKLKNREEEVEGESSTNAAAASGLVRIVTIETKIGLIFFCNTINFLGIC